MRVVWTHYVVVETVTCVILTRNKVTAYVASSAIGVILITIDGWSEAGGLGEDFASKMRKPHVVTISKTSK
jgi:hypothetical protein